MIFDEIYQERADRNTQIEKIASKNSEAVFKQTDQRLYSPNPQNSDSQSLIRLQLAVLTCPSSGQKTDESYLKERFSEEMIDPYSLSAAGAEDEPYAGEECEEVRGRVGIESLQNTESTCASPDSKRLNEIHLFNSHKQPTAQFSLCQLLDNGDNCFSNEDLEGGQDPLNQPPVAVKTNSELFPPRKNISTNLNLNLQTAKPRHSSSSLEGIASPFNFESKDRLSGKTDTTTKSLHTAQERINQKFYQGSKLEKLGRSSQHLDEVQEEESNACSNANFLQREDQDYFYTPQLQQSNQNGERKFARNLLQGDLSQSLSGRHQALSSRNIQIHTSCTQLQAFHSGLRNQQDPSQSKYDQIQEKVFKYFDQEGIHTQAVGDVIRDINCSAFKGMGKLSPLKLDITRSPLKRHRANTIQL